MAILETLARVVLIRARRAASSTSLPTKFSRALSAVLLASTMSAAGSDTQDPTGYDVKAAFIYNFVKFIQWPDSVFTSEASPIELCVVQGYRYSAYFDPITTKQAKGRSFHVQYILQDGDLSRCHILFVPSGQGSLLHKRLAELNKVSTLTVGEDSSFLEQGGIINFVSRDNKIQFQINISAADRANLRISSRLLQLAEIYRQDH